MPNESMGQATRPLLPGQPLLVLGASPTPILSFLREVGDEDTLWVLIHTPGRGWGESLIGRDQVIAR